MYKSEFFEPRSPKIKKRQQRLMPDQIDKALKEKEKLRIETDIPSPTDPFIMTPRNRK